MADSTTKVSEIPSENIKGIMSYEDLYDRCCEYESKIETLKISNEALTKENEECSPEVSELQEVIDYLKAELEETKLKVQELTQITDQQKAEIEFRKKDKHRSEELMDSMTRTITGMKEMNDKLNATVDVLIGKIKE